MNELKHGNCSKKLEMLRENSLNFETRQHKWMSSEDPRNDSEAFLVHRTVALSFELERAARAHLQRLRSAIENVEENEYSAVNAIGERLLHDPAGHRSLYGIPPANRTGLPKTSGNGEVPDANKPSVLVKILESSQIGCLWLRSRFEELKSRLEDPPNNWQAIDRFTATRLLGRHPVECMEHYSVAEIFVASHVIRPVGNSAFEDLLSDMTTAQHDVFVKEIGARWPELKSICEPADARAILIDLCESKIEELNEKLTEHQENAEAIAEAKFNNLGLDETPEGRSVRLYLLKCQNAYSRADELLKKHQGKKKTKEERGYREPRRIEDASRWPEDRARRTPPVARPDMPVADDDVDIAWAKETYPCDQVPDAAPPPLPSGEGRGEGLPQSSLLPRDADGKTREPECHSPAAGEAGHSQEDSAAEPIEEPRDEMTQQEVTPTLPSPMKGEGVSENIENVKNEPKFDEDPVIAKTQHIVGVTANSGVKSGLDSLPRTSCAVSVVSGQLSVVSDQRAPGDAARATDEARWAGGDVVREAEGIVDSLSRGSNSVSQISDLKSKEANPEFQSANVKPQGPAGGRRIPVSELLRREMEMRELKRRFEEKLTAGNVPMGELVLDTVASTAKVAGIPLPHFPRSP